MNLAITHLACVLSEADSEANLKEASYRAALNKLEIAKNRLSVAISETAFLEPLAISLDDESVLVCIWDGESKHDFSIIRSFS
jgi:hypothetical protein